MITANGTGVIYVGDGAPVVVLNNVQPILPFTGGIGISFNGSLLYPNESFALQQDLMMIAGG